MMKHPALARVFAVVLCIFAVLMLLNGTLILLETRRDHRDAVRAYDLLSSRVDEYETLTKKLEEEGPSDRKQGELDALQKQYNKDKAAHQAALAAYTATRGGLKQGQEAMAQADGMMSATGMLNMAKPAIQSAVAELTEQIYAMQDQALNMYAEFDINLQEEDYEAAWARLEAAYTQLEDYGNYMNQSAGSVNINGMLSQVDTLAAGIDAMNAGKDQLQKLELQVIRDSIDLSLAKADLEKQEKELSDTRAVLNEIKADERRLVSLRVSLTANEQIKNEFTRSGNIVSAAKNEMVRSEHAERKTLFLKLAVCLFFFLCACMAFLGMPAAFEKKKSRKLLILPVVLFAGFAGLANAANLLLESRLQYLGFAGLLFALIQLITVLPRVPAEGE